MTRVLFVCLGNICRSPLAEALFKKHVTAGDFGLHFETDSCGTAAYHIGAHPDERSRENARKNGLEYDHLGRKFSLKDFRRFDIIIAMDKANRLSLQKENLTDHGHIYLMRDFDPMGKGKDVPDPYYGGEDGFQQVFDILDRSTSTLLKKLENGEVL